MGFFSLPLAKLVGPGGRVIALDIQKRMLSSLARRARRKGVESIIEPRLCSQENLGLDDLCGGVDLALAVHVAHETAYPRHFLTQIRDALRPGGRLLLVEPSGHVTEEEFETTRNLCHEVGFAELRASRLRRSTAVLLERPLPS